MYPARIAIAVLALVGPPAVGMAEPEATDRPCESSDLVGAWDVAWMNAPGPLDHTKPYYYEHQRFIFSDTGQVTHMTSTKPLDEDDQAIMRQFSTTATYTVADQGWVRMVQPGQEPEVCHCSYMLRDAEEKGQRAQRGDLSLTYVTKQGQPWLQRLLRKR